MEGVGLSGFFPWPQQHIITRRIVTSVNDYQCEKTNVGKQISFGGPQVERELSE
jgi:hypothetical protein